MTGNAFLLGKGAASLHEWCPTFRRTLLLSSSVRGRPRILRSVRNYLPNGTASRQKNSLIGTVSYQKLLAQIHSLMSENSLNGTVSCQKLLAQRHSFTSQQKWIFSNTC